MNNSSTTFYIVRHGESETNAQAISEEATDNYHTKSLGSHLTQKGKEQAKVLASLFEDIDFSYTISSDLHRAKETAEILSAGRNHDIKITDKLRERNYGERPREEQLAIKNNLKHILYTSLDLAEKDKLTFRIADNVETGEEVVERVLSVLEEIATEHPRKKILVTCHGEVIRLLLFHFGAAKHSELPSGHIENTGYIVLEHTNAGFTLTHTQGVNKRHG